MVYLRSGFLAIHCGSLYIPSMQYHRERVTSEGYIPPRLSCAGRDKSLVKLDKRSVGRNAGNALNGNELRNSFLGVDNLLFVEYWRYD